MKDDLMAQALRLAQDGRRPRGIDLRRAVSCAYYALFHALAELCADEMIGVTRRSSTPWARAYRAIDHKQVKDELKKTRTAKLDPAIARIARAFVQLQEARHSADYDPRPFPHKRRDVLDLIGTAKAAIADLSAMSGALQRELLTRLLFTSSRVEK